MVIMYFRQAMQYKRILLKLSGEALMGTQQYGIDTSVVMQYAEEIKALIEKDVEVAIVIGGGNIYRGIQATASGIDRVQGDYMGMLATVINSMALQSGLEKLGVNTRLLTALEIKQVAEPFIKRRAVRHLQKGRVVIFGAGTGNPYFTTDTAAALRATEIEANVILKGTRVDGIYDSDPEKNPKAKKYTSITYADAISQKLNVMDMTAFTLCQENNIPIIVFNMNKEGNLMKIVSGDTIGTLVSSSV
jgi:uridylate kinase